MLPVVERDQGVRGPRLDDADAPGPSSHRPASHGERDVLSMISAPSRPPGARASHCPAAVAASTATRCCRVNVSGGASRDADFRVLGPGRIRDEHIAGGIGAGPRAIARRRRLIGGGGGGVGRWLEWGRGDMSGARRGAGKDPDLDVGRVVQDPGCDIGTTSARTVSGRYRLPASTYGGSAAGSQRCRPAERHPSASWIVTLAAPCGIGRPPAAPPCTERGREAIRRVRRPGRCRDERDLRGRPRALAHREDRRRVVSDACTGTAVRAWSIPRSKGWWSRRPAHRRRAARAISLVRPAAVVGALVRGASSRARDRRRPWRAALEVHVERDQRESARSMAPISFRISPLWSKSLRVRVGS